MTTRATDAKKKKRGSAGYQYLTRDERDRIIAAGEEGRRTSVSETGVVFALGDKSDRGDYTIGGTGLAGERAGSKFALASEEKKEGEEDDLQKKIADAWEKHKTAILFGVGALVVIALARRR
jgi:hypothetical protein